MRLRFASTFFAILLSPALTFAVAESAASAPAKDLHIGTLPADKLLVLGNSITLHPPAPAIGWLGNWGMAASSQEKDFVHLLAADIAKAAGAPPALKVRNIADFERAMDSYDIAGGMKEELALDADIVVIAIGENVPALSSKELEAKYEKAFTNLLAEVKKHGKPALFVRGTFWPDATKDAIMKKACEAAGGVFIDIAALGKDPSNAASAERKFDHAGVAGHPGDKGMKGIADAIWAAIEKKAGAAPKSETEAPPR